MFINKRIMQCSILTTLLVIAMIKLFNKNFDCMIYVNSFAFLLAIISVLENVREKMRNVTIDSFKPLGLVKLENIIIILTIIGPALLIILIYRKLISAELTDIMTILGFAFALTSEFISGLIYEKLAPSFENRRKDYIIDNLHE